jgi:hypothetical protein
MYLAEKNLILMDSSARDNGTFSELADEIERRLK